MAELRARLKGWVAGMILRAGLPKVPLDLPPPGARGEAPRWPDAPPERGTPPPPFLAPAARIELFEAVVKRSPWVLHVPLFRVDGGPLRRLDGGAPETGDVVGLAPMTGLRAARNMPWARLHADRLSGRAVEG